jgi:hypothetical protein
MRNHLLVGPSAKKIPNPSSDCSKVTFGPFDKIKLPAFLHRQNIFRQKPSLSDWVLLPIPSGFHYSKFSVFESGFIACFFLVPLYTSTTMVKMQMCHKTSSYHRGQNHVSPAIYPWSVTPKANSTQNFLIALFPIPVININRLPSSISRHLASIKLLASAGLVRLQMVLVQLQTLRHHLI